MYNNVLKKGFFRLARNVSKYSEVSPKMGAVISKKKPISIGFNKKKPSIGNHSTHAEICALLTGGIFNDFSNCEIYVYREANGLPALARPCDKCMKKLREFGIKKVYYTVDESPYWKVEKL